MPTTVSAATRSWATMAWSECTRERREGDGREQAAGEQLVPEVPAHPADAAWRRKAVAPSTRAGRQRGHRATRSVDREVLGAGAHDVGRDAVGRGQQRLGGIRRPVVVGVDEPDEPPRRGRDPGLAGRCDSAVLGEGDEDDRRMPAAASAAPTRAVSSLEPSSTTTISTAMVWQQQPLDSVAEELRGVVGGDDDADVDAASSRAVRCDHPQHGLEIASAGVDREAVEPARRCR